MSERNYPPFSEPAVARRPRIGERYRSEVHGIVKVRAVWQEGVVVVGAVGPKREPDIETCFNLTEFFRRFTRVVE